MATLAQLRSWLGEHLRDAANHITAAERDSALSSALETYNRHRPRLHTQDCTGDGAAYDFALEYSWIDGFSTVDSVEYPQGSRIPDYLDRNDWILHKTAADAWAVRLLNHTPSAAETLRVVFTTIHDPFDETGQSTIYPNDVRAFAKLGAAVCLKALAARAGESRDSTMSADAVDYGALSDRYLRMAGDLRDEYLTHLGISTDEAASGEATASLAFKDLDASYTWGMERLFHIRADT